MKYQVIRNPKYDYAGQSYASAYPSLHKYPATMLPQIGIDILKELNVSSGTRKDCLYRWKQNGKKCAVTNRPVYCRKICRKWIQTSRNLRTGIE
jgi:hypothetical protein